MQGIFAKNKRLQSDATLSFVDQQLSAARVLQSNSDFEYWINALGQCLIDQGQENRFKDLCEYLLGPPLQGPMSRWQSVELGVNKRALLKELLDRSTSNLRLQRVYLEFKQQLELANSVSNGF